MGELMIPDNVSLDKYQEKDLVDMSKTGDWLPRLAVMGSSHDLVKEAKLPMGVIALITSKDVYVDLGKSLDFLMITWRPHAMYLGESITNYYDRTDPEFQKIVAKADAEGFGSGAMWGPEFLCWVPNQEKFATLFLSSPSARREGTNAFTIMKDVNSGKMRPNGATLKAHFIKPPGSKFSWWGPQLTICTTPIAPMPEQEAFTLQLTKFLNPPKSEVESADPAATAGRER